MESVYSVGKFLALPLASLYQLSFNQGRTQEIFRRGAVDAAALMVKWVKERRKWGPVVCPRKIFEIAPFESMENTVENLFKNECIIDPMLSSSRSADASPMLVSLRHTFFINRTSNQGCYDTDALLDYLFILF